MQHVLAMLQPVAAKSWSIIVSIVGLVILSAVFFIVCTSQWPLAAASLVCSCLHWQCKPKTKILTQTILPTVSIIYSTTIIIWHVIANSTSYVLPPARLQLCITNARQDQNKRHVSILDPLFIQWIHSQAMPVSITGWLIASSAAENEKSPAANSFWTFVVQSNTV